jgi:hypothetical protein
LLFLTPVLNPSFHHLDKLRDFFFGETPERQSAREAREADWHTWAKQHEQWEQVRVTKDAAEESELTTAYHAIVAHNGGSLPADAPALFRRLGEQEARRQAAAAAAAEDGLSVAATMAGQPVDVRAACPNT